MKIISPQPKAYNITSTQLKLRRNGKYQFATPPAKELGREFPLSRTRSLIRTKDIAHLREEIMNIIYEKEADRYSIYYNHLIDTHKQFFTPQSKHTSELITKYVLKNIAYYIKYNARYNSFDNFCYGMNYSILFHMRRGILRVVKYHGNELGYKSKRVLRFPVPLNNTHTRKKMHRIYDLVYPLAHKLYSKGAVDS